MTDIVDRLRFDAVRCLTQFSKGVAANIEEAAAEINRLRAEVRHLGEMGDVCTFNALGEICVGCRCGKNGKAVIQQGTPKQQED